MFTTARLPSRSLSSNFCKNLATPGSEGRHFSTVKAGRFPKRGGGVTKSPALQIPRGFPDAKMVGQGWDRHISSCQKTSKTTCINPSVANCPSAMLDLEISKFPTQTENCQVGDVLEHVSNLELVKKTPLPGRSATSGGGIGAG